MFHAILSAQKFFHPKFFWVKQGATQCFQAFLVSCPILCCSFFFFFFYSMSKTSGKLPQGYWTCFFLKSWFHAAHFQAKNPILFSVSGDTIVLCVETCVVVVVVVVFTPPRRVAVLYRLGAQDQKLAGETDFSGKLALIITSYVHFLRQYSVLLPCTEGILLPINAWGKAELQQWNKCDSPKISGSLSCDCDKERAVFVLFYFILFFLKSCVKKSHAGGSEEIRTGQCEITNKSSRAETTCISISTMLNVLKSKFAQFEGFLKGFVCSN